MKKSILGIALLATVQMSACTSVTPSQTSAAPPQRGATYSVAKQIGAGGGKTFFLIKNGDGWKVARTGNIYDDDVEQVAVNPASKMITLQTAVESTSSTPGQNNWPCLRGLAGQSRNESGYTICTSKLTKGVYTAGKVATSVIAAPFLMFSGSVGTTVEVDQDRILEIAQSSGLLALVEQDRLAEVERVNKLAAEREAADAEADRGSPDAKYKRGLAYGNGIGVDANWSLAEKWFTKAAEAGHADAQYELSLLKTGSVKEKLLQSAVLGGSEKAKAAVEAERARKEMIAAREEQARLKTVRDAALVKEVGQQVCRNYNVTTTWAGRASSEAWQVAGYTEQSTKNKIQVRIGGISSIAFNGTKLQHDSIGGDVVIQTGSVIWVNPDDWRPC